VGVSGTGRRRVLCECCSGTGECSPLDLSVLWTLVSALVSRSRRAGAEAAWAMVRGLLWL
jgi:hypothetical protein